MNYERSSGIILLRKKKSCAILFVSYTKLNSKSMSASVSRNASPTRSWEEKTRKEKASDLGFPILETLVSSYVAYSCYRIVKETGTTIEESTHNYMEQPITFADPSGIQLTFAPKNLFPIEQVTRVVHASSCSGSNAAAGVGIVETVYQIYRYCHSDDKRSWGVDLLEGSYRGAAVGASVAFGTEFLTKKSDVPLGGKILAMATGACIGSILGTGLASLGHIVRMIHVPNRDLA